MPSYAKKKDNSKAFLLMGLVFGVLAVFFTLMHHFNIIKTLDLFLTATYVLYFVGVALLYNGAYCKTKNHQTSRILSTVLGALFCLAAIIMLIYGIANGLISVFG